VNSIEALAKHVLVQSLFLIGSNIPKATLQGVKIKPIISRYYLMRK
jgi:hypothetical protein